MYKTFFDANIFITYVISTVALLPFLFTIHEPYEQLVLFSLFTSFPLNFSWSVSVKKKKIYAKIEYQMVELTVATVFYASSSWPNDRFILIKNSILFNGRNVLRWIGVTAPSLWLLSYGQLWDTLFVVPNWILDTWCGPRAWDYPVLPLQQWKQLQSTILFHLLLS